MKKQNSRQKSQNFVIYKQFSKDVYFALKGAAFFTQLVNASQWHWTADSNKPMTSALGIKRVNGRATRIESNFVYSEYMALLSIVDLLDMEDASDMTRK